MYNSIDGKLINKQLSIAVWLLNLLEFIKIYTMQNHKQFGVWMDNQHATIVGKKAVTEGDLVILAHVTGEVAEPNTSEKNEHHAEKTLQSKYFKEIMTHLQNATHVYVTGTGQAQEQFIHHLAATPQFKNAITEESTSNKMSDQKLLEFMSAKIK